MKWPLRDIYGWTWVTLKEKIKTSLWMLPFLPLASLVVLWIWLSGDFRNQLSKRLHSRNSSPAVFISPGLLSGSSPKHISSHRAAQKQSVAYRAPPHKDWGHCKHTQPQPSKGKTDLRTVINSKKAAGKRSWRQRAQASEDFPLEVERLTPYFMVPVSIRCPQGTGLPTLPLRVPQGAALFGKRISQGPPGNIVAFGMPAPSEEGFRAVSSDASCRFAVSGRRSDCTTRWSVAYRAPTPKNGDTGSVLNHSSQMDLRTVIISKKAAGKETWLILAQSHQLAVRHRDVVLAHLKELVLRLNAKKSVLSPLQMTTFLGVAWDSTPMQAHLSPARIESILSAVKSIRLGQSLTVNSFRDC